MQSSVIIAAIVSMSTKYLIAIVGPTAIGKTALSISLANSFDCEILSADSRQFFKEMNIGTATPSAQELSAATHHFIHHKSVFEPYSVGDFERDALEQLQKSFKTSNKAILVGGSGLYTDAVVKGLDKFPKIDRQIRESLNDRLQSEGLAALQQQLKEVDQKTYEHIAIKNPHRVIRALEIFLGTGRPYSSFTTNSEAVRPFKTLYVGLEAPRELIYERINKRVDKMMAEGLLEEVKGLVSAKDFNSLNTVGYKELFNYLEGHCSLDFAVSEIKKNTRRFAKRQLTWYRKNEAIHWFEYNAAHSDIVQYLQKHMED